MSANTPAEARAGTSDRVAAALSELAALRVEIGKIVWISEGDASVDVMERHLDRTVELLKAEGDAS